MGRYEHKDFEKASNATEDAVHGQINDTAKYPLPKSRWFSDAFDLCMMKRELLKSN